MKGLISDEGTLTAWGSGTSGISGEWTPVAAWGLVVNGHQWLHGDHRIIMGIL